MEDHTSEVEEVDGFVGDLEWETAILQWEEADQLESAIQWRRGDIALNLKPVYGEQTLENFAKTVGVEYGALRNYRWIAQQYENATRVAILSWAHHREVAARDDRLEWLQRAASGAPTWTVSHMLEEIATADAKKEEEEAERRDKERLIEADADIALQVDAGELTTGEGLALSAQRERQRIQEEADYQGQLRRCRDRLNQLSIGWIQLVGMQTSDLREAVLESLSEKERQEFQAIEKIYRRGIEDGTSAQPGPEHSNQTGSKRETT